MGLKSAVSSLSGLFGEAAATNDCGAFYAQKNDAGNSSY